MKLNDYMSAAPHSAAFNVTGSNKVTQTSTFLFFSTYTSYLPHIGNSANSYCSVVGSEEAVCLRVSESSIWEVFNAHFLLSGNRASVTASRSTAPQFTPCLWPSTSWATLFSEVWTAQGKSEPGPNPLITWVRWQWRLILSSSVLLKRLLICPNSHIPAANSRFHFLHAGVHRGHHTGNAGRWDAGVLCHGPHTRQRGVDWDSVWFFVSCDISSFTKLRRKHFDNSVDITELVLTCLFLFFFS